MQVSKDIQNQARRLLRACMDGGTLNEDSVRRVSEVLREKKPRHYLQLLAAFTELVRLADARNTATVKSAVPLTDEERMAVHSKLAARYGDGLHYVWQVDPTLLAGISAQVGDHVTDGSVRGRLASLFAPSSSPSPS